MTLRTYVMKRVAISILILWLVATFNFLVFPNPVANIHLQPSGTQYDYDLDPETRQMLFHYFGWDDPLYIRYLKYLYSMFTLGTVPPYFGWSTLHREFVAEGLQWRLVITVLLLGSALTGAMIFGIPIGVFVASKQGTKIDVGLTISSVLTWGLPSFFVQILAIFVFGDVLRSQGIKIFSTTWTPPKIPGGGKSLAWWGGCLTQLALPILTLVLIAFGSWVLYTRNMLIDALTADYVLTARAKGLNERTVLYKHAFKSILPQISTLIALSLPSVVTGSFITEYIFGIEGIGKFFIKAIQAGEFKITILDPAVTQAVFFIFATLVVLCNLIADIIYGVLDPRIRVGTRR